MEGTRMFIYFLEAITWRPVFINYCYHLLCTPIGYSERRKIFQESLRRLKEGALNFDVFKSICHSEQVKYPEPVILPNIPVSQLETHEYSTKIQPNETRDMTPIDSIQGQWELSFQVCSRTNIHVTVHSKSLL